MAFDAINVSNWVQRNIQADGSSRLTFKGEQAEARQFLVSLSRQALTDAGGVQSGNLRMRFADDGSASIDGRRFKRSGSEEATQLVRDAVVKAYGEEARTALDTYLNAYGQKIGSHSLVKLVKACEAQAAGEGAGDRVLGLARPKADARLQTGGITSKRPVAPAEDQGRASVREDRPSINEGRASVPQNRSSIHEGRASVRQDRSSLDEARASVHESDQDELLSESSRQSSRVPDYEPPFQLPTLGPLRDLLGRAPTELADAAIAEFGGPVVPSLAALAAEAYTRPEDLDRLSAFMAHALPAQAKPEPSAPDAGHPDEVLARYKAQIDFVALLKAYDHPLANDLMTMLVGDAPESDQEALEEALGSMFERDDPYLGPNDAEAQLEYRGRMLEEGLMKPPGALTGSVVLGRIGGNFMQRDLSNNIIVARPVRSLVLYGADLTQSVVLLRPRLEPSKPAESPVFPTISFRDAVLDGATVRFDLSRIEGLWRSGYIGDSAMIRAIGTQENGQLKLSNSLLGAISSISDRYADIKCSLMRQAMALAYRAGVLPDVRDAFIVALMSSREMYLADPALKSMIDRVDYLRTPLEAQSIDDALAESAKVEDQATETRQQRQKALLDGIVRGLFGESYEMYAQGGRGARPSLMWLMESLRDCADRLETGGLDPEALTREAVDRVLAAADGGDLDRAERLRSLTDQWQRRTAQAINELDPDDDGLSSRERKALLGFQQMVTLIGDRLNHRVAALGGNDQASADPQPGAGQEANQGEPRGGDPGSGPAQPGAGRQSAGIKADDLLRAMAGESESASLRLDPLNDARIEADVGERLPDLIRSVLQIDAAPPDEPVIEVFEEGEFERSVNRDLFQAVLGDEPEFESAPGDDWASEAQSDQLAEQDGNGMQVEAFGDDDIEALRAARQQSLSEGGSSIAGSSISSE